MFAIQMWSAQEEQMARLSSECPRGWWLMSGFGVGVGSVHSYSERVDRYAPRVCLDISL